MVRRSLVLLLALGLLALLAAPAEAGWRRGGCIVVACAGEYENVAACYEGASWFTGVLVYGTLVQAYGWSGCTSDHGVFIWVSGVGGLHWRAGDSGCWMYTYRAPTLACPAGVEPPHLAWGHLVP